MVGHVTAEVTGDGDPVRSLQPHGRIRPPEEKSAMKPILHDQPSGLPMPTFPEKDYVARLKCGDIPWKPYQILSLTDEKIGELCLITHDIAAHHDTVEMLCKWRSKHRDQFLTVFNPSLESTRGYLQNIYLPDNSRLLFLLKEYDTFVGHYGLANISGACAELDNVIRSEEVKNKTFMHQAQLALVRWASEYLNINKFYLQVLSGNFKAIKHYERVGFGIVASMPLRKQDLGDGYRLSPDPEEANSDLSLLRMELNI